MRDKTTVSGSFSLLLLMLLATTFTCFGQNGKPLEPGKEKKGGLLMPIYRQGCFPASVSSITGGSFDPGGLVSELAVKSNSAKPIIAIRLGWYVYDQKTAFELQNAACGEKPIEQKPMLSGQTELIELGRMLENQIFNVGTAPRLILWPVDVIVFVKTPLIMLSAVSSLSTDGTLRGMRDMYGLLIAVSEVHFDDGTKWVAEGAPPYMKPAK